MSATVILLSGVVDGTRLRCSPLYPPKAWCNLIGSFFYRMSPKRPLALFLAQPLTTAFNGPAFPTANTPRHNVPRLLCLRCITLSTPQLRSDTNSRGPRQDGAPLPTTFEELLFLLQQRTTINLQRRLARWPVRWSCFLATSAVVVKEYRSMCVLKACLSASVAVHISSDAVKQGKPAHISSVPGT